jgi:hypothetical protein
VRKRCQGGKREHPDKNRQVKPIPPISAEELKLLAAKIEIRFLEALDEDIGPGWIGKSRSERLTPGESLTSAPQQNRRKVPRRAAGW